MGLAGSSDDGDDFDDDGAPSAMPVQQAIDQIVDAVHREAPADDAALIALEAALLEDMSGFDMEDYGHYYDLQRIPEFDPHNLDVLEDQLTDRRRGELISGDRPTQAEVELWRTTWRGILEEDPDGHDLPAYRLGSLRASDGRLAWMVATVSGGGMFEVEVCVPCIAVSRESALEAFRLGRYLC